VLYAFNGGGDGANPYAGVVIGSGGVLFGTTYFGGIAAGNSGYGTVFSLSPPASRAARGHKPHSTLSPVAAMG